jgi:2-dehydropantoate 2-reductase
MATDDDVHSSPLPTRASLRIAIIGAGGVGGYYGALLARAGHAVAFYARGSHLDAIRRTGLTVQDHDGQFTVRAAAAETVDGLRGAQLAIVAVKGYSLSEVAPVARTLAREGAVVLPLLNGVDAAERLAAAGVDPARIIGGSTFVSASRTAPGVVQRHSRGERLVIGEFDGAMSDRVGTIACALRSTGVETVASPDIVLELWQKYAFICAVSAACGMARAPLGAVRDSALGRLLLERAVAEIVAVGSARGVELPYDQHARTMAFIDGLPGALTPSLLLDVQRGGPTELDMFSVAVSRFGKECRVATPIHDTAAAVLPR